MKEKLTDEDIQCLAMIIARIPAQAFPPDTLARLQAEELVAEIPGGWEATEKGVHTVVTWGS